jgi:MFS family permease
MRVPRGVATIRQPFALRNYRLYIVGNIASNIATWLQKVAVGWLTWELTHSAAWLGAMALAEAGPTLVLSLLAGTMVDRVDFFKMLKLAQGLILIYAVATAALTITGLMTVWLLLGLTIMRGAVGAFYRPARMTVVYAIVGREMLPAALAFNSMIFNGSRFVGPALGGAIIVAADAGWAFAAAAGLYFVYSIVLRSIDLDCAPVKQLQRGVIEETAEGLRYILSHRGIRLQLALLLGTAFLARPLTDLLPGFAGEVFDRGAHGLALLLSAHGLGAMAGAVLLAGRSEGINGMTSISFGSILLIGLSLLLFIATPVFWTACVLVAVVGFGFIIQNVTNQILVQTAVEQSVRGRVVSVYGMIQQGMPALGALLMGIWAEQSGMRVPVAAGALLCLLLWLWAWPQRGATASSLEAEPAAKTL